MMMIAEGAVNAFQPDQTSWETCTTRDRIYRSAVLRGGGWFWFYPNLE